MNSRVIIPNFAISGFRSFSSNWARFSRLGSVNLLIGRNNSGKSNVLRFLEKIYPQREEPTSITVDFLDTHQPSRARLRIGVSVPLVDVHGEQCVPSKHWLLRGLQNEKIKVAQTLFGKILRKKAVIDGTPDPWIYVGLPNRDLAAEEWTGALGALDDNEMRQLWLAITHFNSGGTRKNDWEPAVFQRLRPVYPPVKVEAIPAIRKIDRLEDHGGFDGAGIISQLAKLQNPGVHAQELRQNFVQIRDFVRYVLDEPNAEIEVPYERNTIIVRLNGKALPLEALGSGIHEVIIIAAAATVLENTVLCIEEPELHLNPVLQRKLLLYLIERTSNQYFIATHSAALMDAPGVEIYHIEHVDGESRVTPVSTNAARSDVCTDLGYHASDLLQANCVIWVEGPSDRIYLNYWLSSLETSLVEGIHYSIMFYGGKLAAHLTYENVEGEASDFIALRRLNRHGVILIDSDRANAHANINSTKKRLRDEFDAGPGFAWITKGREVENYLPVSQIQAALKATVPRAQPLSEWGSFDSVLKVKGLRGVETQASKVDVARFIVNNYPADLSTLDLNTQMKRLVAFIVGCNPPLTVGK
jgi:energy-coupling factor transporter ATP-binding protein EcfA2